jgi:uncharacterized membrane protein YkvA (DUF1232 family)
LARPRCPGSRLPTRGVGAGTDPASRPLRHLCAPVRLPAAPEGDAASVCLNGKMSAVRWLLGLALALAACWLMLVAFLFVVRPRGLLVREVLRILPDALRLLRRLAGDRSLPVGVRVRLWLLFVYLAIPIDLVPDLVPLIGYADDVVIVVAVLRSVVRRAGFDAIERHWDGTDDGLRALSRMAGL